VFIDPTVDSRIKPLDANRIPVLHTESEVGAVEHNSSLEKCVYEWVIHLQKAKSELKLSSVAMSPLSLSLPSSRTFLQAGTRSGNANITFIEPLQKAYHFLPQPTSSALTEQQV
jgi:hypothetical protein